MGTVRRVEAYTHGGAECEKEPDDKPGNYYVTMVDGARRALLLGPFPNDHRGAQARVDAVRQKTAEVDPMSAFYGFGTCRMPADYMKPGRLNGYMNAENCTHRWHIDSQAGPTSSGVCEFCGTARDFRNSIPTRGWGAR